MNTGRTQRTVLAGTFTAFLLVAGLGNQWVYNKLLDHIRVGDNSGWQLLARISFPHWVVDKSGKFEGLPSKTMTGMLVGAVLLIVAVAIVIAIAARRDGFSAVITGWFATIVGGAVYGIALVTIAGSNFVSGRRSLDTFLTFTSEGAGFGLLVGWAVGIACALAAGPGGGYAATSSYAPPTSTPPYPQNPPSGGGYRY